MTQPYLHRLNIIYWNILPSDCSDRVTMTEMDATIPSQSSWIRLGHHHEVKPCISSVSPQQFNCYLCIWSSVWAIPITVEKLSCIKRGWNSRGFDWENIASCQLSNKFAPHHRDWKTKHSISNGGAEGAQDNKQSVCNEHVLISTSMLILKCALTLAIEWVSTCQIGRYPQQ